MPISPRLQVLSATTATTLLATAWWLTVSSTAPLPEPTWSTSTLPGTAPPAVDGSPGRVPAKVRGGLKFTDTTTTAGFDSPHTRGPLGSPDSFTGGAAAADYDNDGDQDVVLTRVGFPNQLMRNDGSGHFTDVARAARVEGRDQRHGYAAAVWADVDGDSHLDLFLTGAGRTGSVLYRNDGTGHFVDETAARGVAPPRPIGPEGAATFGAAFDDWDHDGDLDLVVLQWYVEPIGLQFLTAGPLTTGSTRRDLCQMANERRRARAVVSSAPVAGSDELFSGSRLYENDGTGRFADVTVDSGVEVDLIAGFQPRFADMDDDGWNDLFITGDACTSRLYRNDRGRGFIDVTEKAGVGDDENGMGSVIDDVDGDGHLDWFVTGISYPTADGQCPAETATVACSGNRLYLGDGHGRFADATDRFGVRDGYWGWGATAEDLNNDGQRDLLMVNGNREPEGSGGRDPKNHDYPIYQRSDHDPTRLWLGQAAAPWPEASTAVGLTDARNGKAVVPFDADGDGDLDLLIANTEGAPTFYRNDTPADPSRHWLILRLRQPGPNPYAIGADVTVDLGDGSTPRRLQVDAGGSFQSGDPTDLHVGLGTTDRVARIEVRWPGRAEPQIWSDLTVDRVVELNSR